MVAAGFNGRTGGFGLRVDRLKTDEFAVQIKFPTQLPCGNDRISALGRDDAAEIMLKFNYS